MRKLVLVLMITALSLSTVPAMACEPYDDGGNCMMLGVGKEASATGFPVIVHNEDDGGRLMVKHAWVPAQSWPAGTMLPATSGNAQNIPQVPNTFGFYWTSVKGFGVGLQNADGFLNEHGVSLMSNSNASSKENTASADLKSGGIQYNLRRVVAERATSARHAVEIIIEMLEKWGYSPSGRAYSIGDHKEIWQVQVVQGNKYVALRVPDDHVIIMSNHYTIKNPNVYAPSGPFGDKGSDVIYPGIGYNNKYPDSTGAMVTRPALAPNHPDHLIGYAMLRGWYTPAVPGNYSDFEFDLAYQASGSYKSASNTYRHAFAADILTGGNAGPLPASTANHNTWAAARTFEPTYKVSGKVSLNTIRKAISYHYEGTLLDEPNSRVAPGNEPHNTNIRRICTGTTIQCALVQFHSDIKRTTLWTAYGRSCILPFLPLHPLAGRIPDIVTLADPAATLKNHLNTEGPDPTRGLYVENKWQRFREFMYMMEMAYDQQIGDVSEIIAKYFDDAQKANALFVLSADVTTSADVAMFDQTLLDDALERLENYIDSKSFLGIPVYTETYFDRNNASQVSLDIVFELPANKVPNAHSLKIRIGGTGGGYLTPVGLTDLGNGKWKTVISRANLTGTNGVNSSSAPGYYDFFLGGRTINSEAFAGIVVILFTDGTVGHNVKFVDHDGKVLRNRFVENGKAAAAPPAPKREGYDFKGWDKAFNNITGALTVTAEFTEHVTPPPPPPPVKSGGSGCNTGLFIVAMLGIAAYVLRRSRA